MTAEPVAVRVRDCACPGTPHEDEGDLVYIAPTLGLAGGLEAEVALLEAVRRFPLKEGAPKDEMARVEMERGQYLRPFWFETFLRHGAVDWNISNGTGEALPFSVDALIADYTIARPVADAANDRYARAVLAPFQEAPRKRSPTGRTSAGTSRQSRPTRKRSGPSSPDTSADTPPSTP